MASSVLLNCGLFVGAYNYTTQMNALALDYGADMLDVTTFGQDSHVRTGGVKSVVAKHEGLWDSASAIAVDPTVFASIGTANVPVTICPTSITVGEPAFIFESVGSEYTPGAAHGEALRFGLSMEGSDGAPLVKGTIIGFGSAGTSGTGTITLIGATSATQRLYASLHVLSVSGTNPTLDVIVQRDDLVGFGSPATALTFPQATAIGSGWQSAAGAITDTYYRVSYTVGGTDTPAFTFLVAIGIA
jgi:hypothetical protein